MSEVRKCMSSFSVYKFKEWAGTVFAGDIVTLGHAKDDDVCVFREGKYLGYNSKTRVNECTIPYKMKVRLVCQPIVTSPETVFPAGEH